MARDASAWHDVPVHRMRAIREEKLSRPEMLKGRSRRWIAAFEPFYSTKRRGLGMGLSFSRSIVEQRGGRLRVVPHDGPGTTFCFTV